MFRCVYLILNVNCVLFSQVFASKRKSLNDQSNKKPSKKRRQQMADSNNSYGLSKKATRRRIVLLADELNRACKEKLEHQLARKDSASTTSFLPENITDVEQVDADLFVHFYEIICDTNLIGK